MAFDEKGKYLTKDKYTILYPTIHAKLRFGFATAPQLQQVNPMNSLQFGRKIKATGTGLMHKT